jgi:hypothetical protein
VLRQWDVLCVTVSVVTEGEILLRDCHLDDKIANSNYCD